jgi:hypothetical protein
LEINELLTFCFGKNNDEEECGGNEEPAEHISYKRVLGIP